MTAPRAVGVRLPFGELPGRVRGWIEDTLGSRVASWEEQVGGMSPGCATRVVTADGTRAFVKAVGSELNPDSPTLFRREIEVLHLIGVSPLWASLRASYDDGGWVALILEDVPGGHPDLADDSDMDALLAASDRLAARLAEITIAGSATAGDVGQPGLIAARARFAAWQEGVEHLGDLPADLVPDAVRDQRDRALVLVRLLAEQGPDQLLHWDIRVDNLLRPAPGRIVFVDWGAAAVGPAWVDPLLARLERVDSPWFDESVRRSPLLRTAGDGPVTGWLVGLGAHLAWRSTQHPPDIGLPTMNEFRRTEARRLLAAAARRLG